MPNLDPWMNQQNSNRNDGNEEQQQEKEEFTTSNKFKQQLLSIKDERQKMIYPNCHPTYNERHEKIIELIDWTLEKYEMNMEKTQQQNEQLVIDNIIEDLDKKRDIAIIKKKKALFKDEVSIYRLEEDTIDYVLFIIRECTGKLI
jgi:hypothetical protein